MPDGRGEVQLDAYALERFIGLLRLGRQLQDFRPHLFARPEFDRGASRDGHIIFGLVWVAADARLPNFYLKNPEISQLDLVVSRQSFRNVIQGLLHNVKDLLLSQVRFFANSRYKMPFGKSHSSIWFLSYMDLAAEINCLLAAAKSGKTPWPRCNRAHKLFAKLISQFMVRVNLF